MTRDYKSDFPILKQVVNGKEVVYLDSAATTQKPISVIEAIDNYYKEINANPHRGVYQLSVKATEAYAKAREKVKAFINAGSTKEIVFTKSATEAFNLLAYSYGRNFIKAGDEIVVSILEHHSNLIPWQQAARATGAILKFMYINDQGIISKQEYEDKITDKTKLVAITQVSNVLGTVNPVKQIVGYAHQKGSVVVVDASQSVPHMKTDVSDTDADFMVFSGHKMMAPMGIGILYGKERLLNDMPPFLFGGDMVEYVYEQETTYAELPEKFEGGTQNVEAAVGLSAAIDYINQIGIEVIERHEQELAEYALCKLKELPYVTVYAANEAKIKTGVISFNIDGVHPHDVASIIDNDGIAIRVGNHCAQPLLRHMGVNATCRVSLYIYNTKEDVDKFIESLKKVRKWLGYGS